MATSVAINKKIQAFIADCDLAHMIVHGNNDVVVSTDGGPVDSFSRLMKRLEDSFNSGVGGIFDTVIGEYARRAETAAGAAETAAGTIGDSVQQAEGFAAAASGSAGAASTSVGEAAEFARLAALSEAAVADEARQAAESATLAGQKAEEAGESALEAATLGALRTEGAVVPTSEWTAVPAVKNSREGATNPINEQAQALANRAELLRDNQKRTPIHFATFSEAVDAAAALPDGQAVEAPDSLGRTTLYKVTGSTLVTQGVIDTHQTGEGLVASAQWSQVPQVAGRGLPDDLNGQAQALLNRAELLRDNQKRTPLRYATLAEAGAAAAALPDGQEVASGGGDYVVTSGELVWQRPSASVAEVGTVAELRALPPPKTRCTVYVRGYHAESDGGGGYFMWVPASNKADNGGNVIAPNSAPPSGRWEWDGVADVRRFGAQLNTGDSTLAIRSALKTGKKVLFSGVGDYFVSDELEVTHAGQVIEWEQTGGYGYGVAWATGWQPRTRLMAVGNFPKRIRTRRLHRANALMAEDAPISVVFNVQAEGVYFSKTSIFLQCDYSDPSPTNMGADCDVAIFVASRVGIQIHDPQIIGYFRSAGILFDVTGSFNLPRFPSLDGTPYDQGTVRNGGDGTHVFNPFIHGPMRAIAIMGAKPAPGFTAHGPDYVDAVSGLTVTDGRGNVGFSDFLCIGGRLYGPDHHSTWRRKDPILSGGVLNLSTLLAEPDTAPAVVHIDGLAANSSSNLWGMRFIGTRFSTFEMFRLRLDKASRVSLINCHVEGRGGAGLSATGAPINTNDTTTVSYGDIAGTTNTDRFRSIGAQRQTPQDSHLVHYYGQTATMETESGRYYLDSAGLIQARAGYLELRGATGEGIRFRAGDTTLGAISTAEFTLASGVIRSTATELDLRASSSGLIRLRNGSSTFGTLGPDGAVLSSTIRHTTDNTSSFGSPSFRGSTIYLGSNPVVTSDGREKQQVRCLSEAEHRVAVRLKALIKAFKYNDAVVLKGDEAARIHVGWIAQEVKAAFEAEGLNGFEYACLCYDEWSEQPERLDEEGNVIQPRREAGNRYGVRESQLLTFIVSAL